MCVTLADIDLLASLPWMWRFARKLRPHNPEDLVQETAILAIRHRGDFVEGEPITWLSTIMENACIDMAKQDVTRAERDGRWALSTIESGDRTVKPRQEDCLYAVEVMRAIDRISPMDARTFALHGMGYSDQERADIQGIPLSTAKTRLRLARARLLRSMW